MARSVLFAWAVLGCVLGAARPALAVHYCQYTALNTVEGDMCPGIDPMIPITIDLLCPPGDTDKPCPCILQVEVVDAAGNHLCSMALRGPRSIVCAPAVPDHLNYEYWRLSRHGFTLREPAGFRGRVDFGTVPPGGAALRTLVVVNDEANAMTLTAASPAEPFSIAPPSMMIGAGEIGVFILAFSPTAMGDSRGRIVFTRSGTAAVDSVRLEGTGAASADVPAASERPPAALAATPNPATHGVELTVRLATPASVRLEVHDLLGRSIRTIAAGDLGVGEHRYVWDMKRADAVRVPPGLYVARLMTASGEVASCAVAVR